MGLIFNYGVEMLIQLTLIDNGKLSTQMMDMLGLGVLIVEKHLKYLKAAIQMALMYANGLMKVQLIKNGKSFLLGTVILD